MTPRRLGPCSLACAAGLIVTGAWLQAVSAQRERESRMVIATNVVCRAAPSLSAPVVRGYAVGDGIGTARSVEADGGTWYSDDARASGARPACWVFGALTAPHDPTSPVSALLAAADHVLGRTDEVPFEDYVAVENLLLRTTVGAHRDDTVLASSGLLQLRRMQIVQRALTTPPLDRTTRSPSPLTEAWLIAHRDLVWHFEPGGLWATRPETFWALFDQHRSEPWAEQIAWAAAETRVYTDECDAACVVWTLNLTYARYWAAFPQGPFVEEALAKATEKARYAASICPYGAGDRLQQELAAIGESLGQVTSPGRTTLAEQLDAVERGCRGPLSRPYTRP